MKSKHVKEHEYLAHLWNEWTNKWSEELDTFVRRDRWYLYLFDPSRMLITKYFGEYASKEYVLKLLEGHHVQYVERAKIDVLVTSIAEAHRLDASKPCVERYDGDLKMFFAENTEKCEYKNAEQATLFD